MQKFLRTMMLLAALALPFASNAQVTADRTYLNQDFSVANPEGWTGGSGQMPTFSATGNPTWMHTAQAMNGLAAGHYYYNLYAPDRYQWLVSPEMDLTESGEAELRFDIALTDFALASAPATIDSGKVVMVLVRSKANTPGAAWTAWQTLRKWVVNPGEGELDITELTADYTTDTADFAAYLGKFVQVAFYCENTTPRASSVNIHVDNVVVDGKIRAQAPTEVTLEESGSTTAVLSWVDNLNPVVDHYEVMAVHGEDTVYAVSNGDQTTATVSGLTPATTYNFFVRSYVDANTWSVWSTDNVSAFTHYANPMVPDFAYDFEEGAEGWIFANGTSNGWYLGTEVLASHNVDSVYYFAAEDSIYVEEVFDHIAEGADTLWSFTTVVDNSNNVLWVSNNGGTGNNYSHGNNTIFAYMPVQLEAGDYNFGLNWRAGGESNYDYAVAAIVSENETLNALNSYYQWSSKPGSWQYVSDKLNLSPSAWSESYNTFTVGSDGIYKLVLMWTNDGSGGNQPAIAIDNMFLSKVVCFPVENLAQNDSATAFNAIALDWEDPLEVGTYRIVAIGGGDTIEAVVEAPEMPYVLTHDSIKAETTYQVNVYTVCGVGSESNPAHTTATTYRLCEPVTELAAEPNRCNVTLNWVDIRNVAATYDVILTQAGDTVATVEGAESGVVINGLQHTTDYVAIVIAHSNDTTASATKAFSTPCPQAEYIPTATYIMNLKDEYGGGNCDGWNNNKVEVYVDDVKLDEYTLQSSQCNNHDFEIVVPAGSKVDFKYVASGSYQTENSVIITHDGEQLISTGKAFSSGYNSIFYTISEAEADGISPDIINCSDVALTVTVADRTSESATFEWEQNLEEEVNDYHIVVKAGNTVVVDDTVAALTYTAEDLTPSTNYTVTVGALCEDGFVLESEVVAFETRGPCNAPEDFTAVATRASISLSWTQDDPNIETYQLYYTTDANADLAALEENDFITVSGNDGYTILNLTAGTTYYFYLRSNCGENQSAWRDATVATLPLVDCTVDGGTALVANGTNTNSYVPFYGCYLDTYTQHSQFIYPAEMLTDLAGKTIKSMTFYFGANKTFNVNAEFRMGTCDETTLNTFIDAELTTVWSGSLVTANNLLVLEFAEPYAYEGGNLLVEFQSLNTGNYSCNSFSGISSTGSSIYQGNGGVTQQNFLPKVTFGLCGEGAACAAVEEVAVSDVDYNTATISWERPDCKVNGYLLVLSDTAVVDFTGVQATELGDITEHVFAELDPTTNYHVYLATVCGEAEGDTSAWAYAHFETPAYCRVADSLVATLNGRNSALVRWHSTSSTQPANFGYILDTVALDADSLLNYEGTIHEGITADSVQLDDLDYEKTYYFYVRNLCQLGETSDPAPWSEGTSFTTDKQEMPAVIVNAPSVYRNTITVTWSKDIAHFADEEQWQVAYVKTADDADDLAHEWTIVDVDSVTIADLDYETSYRVYVRAYDNGNYSDSVRVQATTGINMPQVTSVNAMPLSHNYAHITWERGFNAIETQWLFAMKEAADTDDFAYVLIDHMDTMIYGLTELTTYDVSIIAVNGEDSSVAKDYSFTTASMAAALSNCLVVGNENSTSGGRYPIDHYYNYTLSEFIVDADELENAQYTAMSFYFASTSGGSKSSVDIYLQPTNKSTFNNNNDYEALNANAVLVYSGSVNMQQGWNKIDFANKYKHEGGNLMVIVNDRSHGYNGSYSAF